MVHPTHKTRFSDSSFYDEVCTLCGVTDTDGMADLSKPCSHAPAELAKLKDFDDPVEY